MLLPPGYFLNVIIYIFLAICLSNLPSSTCASMALYTILVTDFAATYGCFISLYFGFTLFCSKNTFSDF